MCSSGKSVREVMIARPAATRILHVPFLKKHLIALPTAL